ncbi:P-loop containing nucleoside triphosphate hydrolase protein [Mrakia frigida]|uniref:P-loop containing nucleoside triphosphate hydrolase protein n=1 Tax=Mrakia frigida TaxID=29902 RepID=UPI003FCC1136
MAKRRVLDSDEEEEEDPSSQGVEESPHPSKRSRSTATGLRTPSASVSIERSQQEDEDEDEEDEEEEGGSSSTGWRRRKEEEDGQRRRKVAEKGIITRIILENFLNHLHADVELGPNVNFLTGANGSGKSAVLTGISVGLGAKVSATGRGSNVAKLINEKKETARITIYLKNAGSEPYLPSVYGKEIVVERTLQRRGNSSAYRIMSLAGKTISTKKEELARILDWMNIQIDNPINVLSQDAAKAFLTSSTPEDKYKFFLEGTNIAQLERDYFTISQHIASTNRALSVKKTILPEQKERLKEVEQQVAAGEDAGKALEEMQRVEGEALWRLVVDQEEVVREVDVKVDKMDRRVLALQKAADQHQTDVTNIETAIRTKEGDPAREARTEAMDRCTEKIAQFRADKREVEKRRNQARNDREEMKTSRSGLVHEINTDKETIRTELAKLEVDNSAEKAARDEQIQTLIDSIDQANAGIPVLQTRIGSLTDDRTKSQTSLDALLAQIRQVDTDLATMQGRKNNLVGGRGAGPLAAYGKDLHLLIAQIQSKTWRGEKPLGPLGLGVKLKDERYSNLVQSVLGPVLCSFAVTHAQDRYQLLTLLKGFRNSFHPGTFPQIIIYRPDQTVDISSGDLNLTDGYKTFLSLLEIDNWRIRNLLVDQAGIEQLCIAPDRQQATSLALRLRKTVWSSFIKANDSSAAFYRFSTKGGSVSANFHNQWRGPGLFVADHEEEIRTAEQEIAGLRRNKDELQQSRNTLQGEIQKNNADQEKIRQAITRLNDQIRRKKVDVDFLVEANREEQPPNIAGMQATLDGKEATLLDLDAQLGDNRLALDQEQEELRLVNVKIDEGNAELAGLQQEAEGFGLELIELVASLAKARNDLKDRQAKLRKSEGDLAALRTELETETRTREERTEGAATVHPERMDPRTDAQIRAHSVKLNARIQLRRAPGAMPLEAALALQSKLSDALKTARVSIRELDALKLHLANALEIRTEKLSIWRRSIATRAKQLFLLYLSKGNFSGKLMFDHKKETLDIKVCTDELETENAHSAPKDPNQLSGGEKSFSTVALLMALWESVGCPIRCLDEFDVFMDAVRRRMAVQLLIDTAKSTPDTQFILITPLDMSGVVPGKEVKIIRFADPKGHDRNE